MEPQPPICLRVVLTRFQPYRNAVRSHLSDGLGSTPALLMRRVAPTRNTVTSHLATPVLAARRAVIHRNTLVVKTRHRALPLPCPLLQSKAPAFYFRRSNCFAGGDANLYAYVSNSPCNATDPPAIWVHSAGGALSVYEARPARSMVGNLIMRLWVPSRDAL